MITKEELLSDLNPQQREAVEINSGSLLVFAGAGSGKTRVITTKIAYAITQLGVKPYEILAVTFTNKACREMKERVESFVGPELADQTVIRTFHSFGVWLLRRFGDRVGLAPNFTIYDDKDSAKLLATCFPNEDESILKSYSKKISLYKDKMMIPSTLDENLNKYFEAYNGKLAETGNVDFADMIIKSIELLQNNQDVRDYIHNRFSMILVDEYQDSNEAQNVLLKQIVGPATHVCVVGDDDQSIYRFRGAQVKNILDFPKMFDDTKTIVLGKNYRCSQSILNVANDVIQNNKKRAEKDLVAEHEGGKKPTVYYVNHYKDEPYQIARIIKNDKPKKTAIIYRTNAQSKVFEDALRQNGIPYQMYGDLRYYDREEIKDSISLLRFLLNPRDTVSFQRMVNKPTRGIGDVTINKIVQQGGDMIAASKDLLTNGVIKGKSSVGLNYFIDVYERCINLLVKENNQLLVNYVLHNFGIIDYYKKRDIDDHTYDSSRVENLNQFIEEFENEEYSYGLEGLCKFLETVSLEPSEFGQQIDKENENVALMTMHTTKGLEFDRVFIVGMEESLFPSTRGFETSNEDLEEERRICYVAMTRARSELYMFASSMRFIWGEEKIMSPSRFFSEIKPSHIDVVDQRYSSHSSATYGYSFGFPKRESSTNYLNTRKRDSYDDWTPQPKVQIIKKAAKQEPKEVIDWKVGDRVNSQLMGPGTITSMKKFGNRDVMLVTFDSGKIGNYVKDKAEFTRL